MLHIEDSERIPICAHCNSADIHDLCREVFCYACDRSSDYDPVTVYSATFIEVLSAHTSISRVCQFLPDVKSQRCSIQCISLQFKSNFCFLQIASKHIYSPMLLTPHLQPVLGDRLAIGNVLEGHITFKATKHFDNKFPMPDI